MELNDLPISGASSSMMHYKTYVQNILSHDDSKVASAIRTGLFAMDTAGQFDATGNGNEGLQSRRERISGSNLFDLMVPLNIDFASSLKHLTPKNRLTIRMYKERDSFLLTSAAAHQYKIKVMDSRIYFRRTKLAPEFRIPLDQHFLSTKTVMLKWGVPQGTASHGIDVCSGTMPKKVAFFQVLTRAVEGSYQHNPFHFQHFNINYLSVGLNGGTKMLPVEPYRPNFTSDPPLTAREYAGVFKNTGMFKTGMGNSITWGMFNAGCTIFPFDLSPDLCSGFHLHPADTGTVRVQLGWGEPLTAPITVFAYLEFDELDEKKDGSMEMTSTLI